MNSRRHLRAVFMYAVSAEQHRFRFAETEDDTRSVDAEAAGSSFHVITRSTVLLSSSSSRSTDRRIPGYFPQIGDP